MDPWVSGQAYERYVGRWSRPVAREFVEWLEIPARRRWLDVGCGTGALTETVLSAADPADVVGVDSSPAFVEHAAAHVTDPRASFRVGDGQSLPIEDASVDAVVSGLVLNFIPDRAAALREMQRVAGAGGVVAAYVWDYLDGMQLMRHFWDAAVERDPSALPEHESVRFEFCRQEPLRDLFAEAGLKDVDVRAIVVPTTFADFDDYWTPFLGGQGPAPAHAMSLSEDDRGSLRETLRARLPTDANGAISLTARAWAVRGATH